MCTAGAYIAIKKCRLAMIIMVCWLVELVLPRVDTQTLINKTQHEIIYTNANMNMHECIMMSSVHYSTPPPDEQSIQET